MLYQFSEHLWYTGAQEETDRPVLGYLRGDRRTLLIDAGNSARHANELQRLLSEQNLPTPDLIVLTHSHWDHCYGLCAWKAVSICSAATKKDLERDAVLQWSDTDLQCYLES